MSYADAVEVAPGFRIYFDEDIHESWVVNGCLPTDPWGPWIEISHYDVEQKLVEAGLIKQSQCDSESSEFWVYPDTEDQARTIGAWLKERLERPTKVATDALLA